MRMLKIEKLLVNSWWSKKRVLELAQRLLSFVEINGSKGFLEVGCGNGVVSKYLAKKFQGNVVGIDIDRGQIELARQKIGDIPNIHFLEADATKLPFADNSFDVVISFGVLHHITDWLDALKEMKRVLRAKGYFIYADLIYPERMTKIDSSSKHSFGLVTIRINELNSFIEEGGFITIYSSLTKSFICRNYEAVYRRG